MNQKHVILADIGGTNARFWLRPPQQRGFETLFRCECADFPSFAAVLQHVRGLLPEGGGARFDLVLAVAGPVAGDEIRITNNHWHFSQTKIKTDFDIEFLSVLNDLQAAAMAYPLLNHNNTIPLFGATTQTQMRPHQGAAFIGLGTGLGAAQIFRDSQKDYFVQASEAGQRSFGARDEVEQQILRYWQDQTGQSHLPSEFFVSGAGIERIYQALSGKEQMQFANGFDIMQAAAQKKDATASAAANLFFTLLGRFAGDYVLSTAPPAGLFIVSQVLQTWQKQFIQSDFYTAFCDKGRFADYCRAVPIFMVTEESPICLGLQTVYAQNQKN